MGWWKEQLLHQMEAGYSHRPMEKYVCPGCIADGFLREDVEAAAADHPCSYCGASSAADIIVVLDSVADFLATEYEDPAHRMPYESREGGYQGVTYGGYELVRDLDHWTDVEDLLEDVAHAFAGSAWCEIDYFSLKEDDKLRYGWQTFVELVKHHTRYLFFDEPSAEASVLDEPIPAARMLESLGELLHRFRLYAVIERGKRLYRARVHSAGESVESAAELGPPPKELAARSNRMSPAGVSMFYGALDCRTAVLETVEPDRAESKSVSIGAFEADRDLLLLDLTKLPEFPSPFDTERRPLRRLLDFLYEFVYDLTKPVERDGREHVEYAPTQVVTEYVRHRHRDPDGRTLDGILYSSSREGGEQAVVLFLEHGQCGPDPTRNALSDEQVLTLVGVEVIPVEQAF